MSIGSQQPTGDATAVDNASTGFAATGSESEAPACITLPMAIGIGELACAATR